MSNIIEYKDLSSVGMQVSDAEELIKAYDIDAGSISNKILQAQNIKVTSIDDVSTMKEAKTLRQALAKHRISTQKRHDELKKNLLVRTKAIDLVNRVVGGKIKEVEAYLKSQEDYAKIVEEKRRQEIANKRAEELKDLVEDVTPHVDRLGIMTEDEFTGLKLRLQAEKEQREAELARQEEERKREEEARIAAEVERRLAEEQEKRNVDKSTQDERKINPALVLFSATEDVAISDKELVRRAISQIELIKPQLSDDRYIKFIDKVSDHIEKTKDMYLKKLDEL